MKRILFVQIASGMGGAAHSLMLLASNLQKFGYEPVIAGQQDREGVWEEADSHGIPYRPLYLTSWAKSDLSLKDIRYIPNRLNAVRRLRNIIRHEKIDLVHTNLPFCDSGALAAKSLGVPHVFHIRDEFSPLYRTWFGGNRGAVRTMRRFSDRIISVSTHIAAEFDLHGAGDTVRVIPNAVTMPDDLDSIDGARERERFGLPHGVPLIGVMGVLAERKGQIDLIHAISILADRGRDVHGVLVGPGYDDYETMLRNEVARLGLDDRVHFIGHQPRIWSAMRAVDILAVPSRAEGFGRIVVEGMAAERPVVAARTGGITDIITNGVNGLLVEPASPDELAAGLERLLDDEPFARKLATEGKRRAREVYTPEAHVKQVIGVYEELLEGK